MYVMVLHEIANPEAFWKKAIEAIPTMPSDVQLHHTFSAPDGAHAVCIWEAESITPVKNLLAPMFAGISSDTYLVVNNREGVVVPPQFVEAPVTV